MIYIFFIAIVINSFFFRIYLILHVVETTFRHITNWDATELVINEVISKETLERAEERMQYFKGHTFVLLKVYNFVDTGLGFFFFNPIQFFSSSREGGGGGGGGRRFIGTVIF